MFHPNQNLSGSTQAMTSRSNPPHTIVYPPPRPSVLPNLIHYYPDSSYSHQQKPLPTIVSSNPALTPTYDVCYNIPHSPHVFTPNGPPLDRLVINAQLGSSTYNQSADNNANIENSNPHGFPHNLKPDFSSSNDRKISSEETNCPSKSRGKRKRRTSDNKKLKSEETNSNQRCTSAPSASDGPESATVSPPALKVKRRVAATQRERFRSRKINDGFDVLRRNLPEVYQGRKLSKHETLMLAQAYISQLANILDDPSSCPSSPQPPIYSPISTTAPQQPTPQQQQQQLQFHNTSNFDQSSSSSSASY